MPNAKGEIVQLIEAYFSRQSEFDGDGMPNYWNTEEKMHLVGDQGEFRVVIIEEQVEYMKEAKERVPELTVN